MALLIVRRLVFFSASPAESVGRGVGYSQKSGLPPRLKASKDESFKSPRTVTWQETPANSADTAADSAGYAKIVLK
ncbi:hypothetical protein [Lactiplantibacillus paraxiangfangensis]|uniref:hypothetical protein n=1 Tax=Lactiplantibacillus paraxiangfangensis TaxID=3076224 RepID=UPI0030C6FDA9